MKKSGRSHRIGLPVPVRQWIAVDDFRAGLAAAFPGVELDDARLARPVIEMAEIVRIVLRGLTSPDPVSVLEVASELQRIARGQSRALARLWDGLGFEPRTKATRDVLVRALKQSDLTVVVALLDAASADGDAETAADRLAEALLSGQSLAPWAKVASAAYRDGGLRPKARNSPDDEIEEPEFRELGRLLGYALVYQYAELTGRPVAVSRRKPGDPLAGLPVGPLVRFTTTILRRLRVKLSKERALATIAQNRIFEPSPETLTTWAREYRAVSGAKRT